MKKVSILLTCSVLVSLITLAVVPFFKTLLRQEGGMAAPIDGVAVTGAKQLLGTPHWDPGESIEPDGFNFVYGYNEGGSEPFDLTPQTPGNTLVATGADPNNPMTTIGYTLPQAEQVHIGVYNVLGRAVATLVDARQPAGHHEAAFDARHLPSGIYVYRLQAGAFSTARRLVVLK